jgi:ATP-binding cassette subfamily B protein
VFLDGHDILDIPLSKLRRQIGYVPQDIFLFSASIKENIAFAVKEAGDTKVEQAAKQAQLYDSIMDFPDRFETEIGERGVTLSGGQKQRLALARALIKEAPILILDDSLSAVDTETEAAILTALHGLRGRQTTLIIAHRISAVREADVILVLNEGTLVQSGNHDALLAVPGPYRDIYELQKKGTGTVESGEPDRQTTQKGNAS